MRTAVRPLWVLALAASLPVACTTGDGAEPPPLPATAPSSPSGPPLPSASTTAAATPAGAVDAPAPVEGRLVSVERRSADEMEGDRPSYATVISAAGEPGRSYELLAACTSAGARSVQVRVLDARTERDAPAPRLPLATSITCDGRARSTSLPPLLGSVQVVVDAAAEDLGSAWAVVDPVPET